MRRPRFPDHFALLTVIVAAVIVYGCLYPFDFRYKPGDGGPLRALIRGGIEWHGQGDFLANILLYMPLGFFGALSTRAGLAAWKAILLAVLGGTALSIAVELTQYYDAGRTTAAVDVYWNAIGAGLGAVAGCIAGGRFRGSAFAAISENRAPALLLAAWLGWRLLQLLLPAADRHALVAPSTARDLLRSAAIWLTLGSLLGAVAGRRGARLLFPLLAAAALAARALAAGGAELADAAGAGLAWLALLRFGDIRPAAAGAALLLAAAAIGPPLGPGAPAAAAGHFGWMPFAGYMQGSVRDVVLFLQKCFFYGGVVWLLGRAGLRLRWATALAAAALLLAAWAGVGLLGRPAEIGDAAIAMLIAAVMAALNAQPPTNPDDPPQPR